jgi:ERCC4-type nuclease
MLVKIDAREQELISKLNTIIQSNPKFKDIQIETVSLPIGDIIVSYNDVDHIIIERKTVADLAASIKDGRYVEQSYRLNGIQHPNHNIVYLIEGDIEKPRFISFKDRLDKQAIYSAMFSIFYFKGFSLMRTNSVEETATVICNMAYKLAEGLKSGKSGYYSEKQGPTNTNSISEAKMVEEPNGEEKNYCSVIKRVKKDNITANNIGEIMLCQIPGVSPASALTILTKYKTLPNLIKAIQEDEKCLNNLANIDSNGKSRKISKTTIATIINFLRT